MSYEEFAGSMLEKYPQLRASVLVQKSEEQRVENEKGEERQVKDGVERVMDAFSKIQLDAGILTNKTVSIQLEHPVRQALDVSRFMKETLGLTVEWNVHSALTLCYISWY